MKQKLSLSHHTSKAYSYFVAITVFSNVGEQLFDRLSFGPVAPKLHMIASKIRAIHSYAARNHFRQVRPSARRLKVSDILGQATPGMFNVFKDIMPTFDVARRFAAVARRSRAFADASERSLREGPTTNEAETFTENRW